MTLHVSCLQSVEEYNAVLGSIENCNLSAAECDELSASISKPIGIKQLLMVVEMARSNGEDDGGDEGKVSPTSFIECLLTFGF